MKELDKIHNQLTKENTKKIDVLAPLASAEFVAKEDNNYLILQKGRVVPSEYHDYRKSDIHDRVLELSAHALQQLCSTVGVPMSYLAKCEPAVREYNISHWLKRSEKNNLFRCMIERDSSRVRGIMSERYTPVSDSFVVDCLMKAIQKSNIENPILTRRYIGEDMLRLQVSDAQRPIVGDTTLSFYVKNSEIGLSSLAISMGVFTYSCTNGLMIPNLAFEFSRRHIGAIAQDMISGNFQKQISSIMGNYGHMMKYMDIASQVSISKSKFRKYIEGSKDFSLDFRDSMKSRIRQLPTKNVLWKYVSQMTEQAQQYKEQERMEYEKQAGKYMDEVIRKEVKRGKYQLTAV